MILDLFHIDAFASAPFRGNPAAVVPLTRWLPDAALQAIAAENNLSETAFLIPAGDDFAIRWFTPVSEVDLCGHATLAAAHVLLNELKLPFESLRFSTKQAGDLLVNRDGPKLSLDFPSRPPTRITDPAQIRAVTTALGADILELWSARDLLAILPDEQTVRTLRPDIAQVAALDAFALIASARGAAADFVSRFFAPRQGIPEDPVTGSAHCTLIPYWARVLNKTDLFARQLSARGGELWCRLSDTRVHIAGHAITYLRGTIHVP